MIGKVSVPYERGRQISSKFIVFHDKKFLKIVWNGLKLYVLWGVRTVATPIYTINVF